MDIDLEPIGLIDFSDGTIRHVYILDGRQFVIDEGRRIYGVWHIPEPERIPEQYDAPMVVGMNVTPFE